MLARNAQTLPGQYFRPFVALRWLEVQVRTLVMKALSQCRLYAFVDTAYLRGRPPEQVAKHLCEGGADLIQVRAKGATDGVLKWKHVLRNALIPVVTVLAIQVPRLVSGAAITETVFSWPGMGRLGVQAALGRDYPLVMAITLFVSVAVVVVNILVDLFYLWADPRIRLEAS